MLPALFCFHGGRIKFFSCHYAESQQKILPLHLNFFCCTLQRTEMSTHNLTRILTQTIDELSRPESLEGLFHQHEEGFPLPSAALLTDIIELTRAILFPGYYGKSTVNSKTIKYQIGVNVEELHRLLSKEILAGLCFNAVSTDDNSGNSYGRLNTLRAQAEDMAARLISRLPQIRRMLATDVEAAYNGDPAAESYAEVISCYPVIKTLTVYRVAHELFDMKVPLIPRMMTEMAHSETGMDIHPGAKIGKYFTIDHGTGLVIGETCEIGDNVKLYQGVTLGAKSFPLDENGNPIKGIPRHPIIGNDVIIYANATILGRVHIGDGCVIGANVWVTRDMKPNTKKYKQEKIDKLDIEFNHGTGI